MRIRDLSSDVCSSDLLLLVAQGADQPAQRLLFLQFAQAGGVGRGNVDGDVVGRGIDVFEAEQVVGRGQLVGRVLVLADVDAQQTVAAARPADVAQQRVDAVVRLEEHTSELQSLMRTSYAVFCLK